MTPAKAHYFAHDNAPRQSSCCCVWETYRNTNMLYTEANFRLRTTLPLFLSRSLTPQIVITSSALFSKRPSDEYQQGYDEGAEHSTRDDDVFPHFQSLFQFPFFQISQTTTRSPIRTSRIAASIPTTHSMRFPIHESKAPQL